MIFPAEMKVVEIAAPGGPEQLKPATRPMPQPGEGEVLVRVEAAGVNRPDVMQRQGRYPPPPGASDLPGMEIAGEIVALGPKVSGLSSATRLPRLLPGRRLCRLRDRSGSLGACPCRQDSSMVEAAALPETFLTVWTNLFERGGCKVRRRGAHSWRHQRHRHHRDPARERVGRHGFRHRGIREEGARLRAIRRGARHRLQDRGLRCK